MKLALEQLNNISEVAVAGSGSNADPWVVTFLDPSEPVVELEGSDALVGGTLAFTDPGIDASATGNTGLSSGASFSVTGTVDTLGDALESLAPTSCAADELCILIEASIPGVPFRIHCNASAPEARLGDHPRCWNRGRLGRSPECHGESLQRRQLRRSEPRQDRLLERDR